MLRGAPTVLTLQTDSAWLVIVAVCAVTLLSVVVLRRVIGRPGGLASGILLSLPLTLPLVAALVYSHAVLPEVAVLRPAVPALLGTPGRLLHLLLLSDGRARIVVPYALSGSAGHWLFAMGASFSCVMLVRRLLGHVSVGRLLQRCRPLDPSQGELSEIVTDLAGRMNLHPAPEVLLLPEGVVGAFATGGRTPRIVLSRDLLECLDHAELEAIVAHEMAHINSHDVHLLVGAGLLRDVVAWNPFAHLALRHLSADRELEADRQAAAITRNPLAVASGLLKMCELMRTRRRLMAGVSVAFVRPRGAMTKRVSSLIRVADGKAPVARAGWGPYIGAACVAAVLGLAVGARVARNDGAALAVVLGAPQSSSAELQSFEDLRGLKRPPPGRRAEKATTAKASERRARATKAPPLGRLAVAPVALSERDFPKWVAAIAALAKSRGIPPEQVRREVRENWHAIPLLPSHPPAPIGIYTMELRP